jgi:hypothetical protein
MTRSALRLIPNSGAVDALLVMAHPWRWWHMPQMTFANPGLAAMTSPVSLERYCTLRYDLITAKPAEVREPGL